MKNRRYRSAGMIGSLMLALGAMISPCLQAQGDRPAPPPPQPEAPANAPEAAGGERMQLRIRELHAEGKHDEAEQMAQRVRHGMRKPTDRQQTDRKPKVEAERRRDGAPVPPRVKIQHLRQAAEHLQAAGYEEQAQKARQEIGRIEAEARKMEDEKRPDPAAGVKEEMNKLRREVEELRAQLRKMKAGMEPHSEDKPKADGHDQ